MTKKLISLVVGTRPNFMKIAPIIRAIERSKDYFSYRLVHTNQHSDKGMNTVFFNELGIPKPDVYLKGGGVTHAEQTARIMVGFEQDCIEHKPDIVLVVGDVNSTLACAIAAKKLHIQLVHVEAGLRSDDREMPEEINRLIVDSISDLLFVTEPSGLDNLLNEGHSRKKVHYVGNVMVDNLFYQKSKLENIPVLSLKTALLKETLGRYGVLTLHRPSNVDNKNIFKGIVKAINEIALELPIIFPIHPRTKKNIDKFNIKFNSNIYMIPPMTYVDFLNVWKDSVVVLTDSGGLQEETSALGVNCITIRNNTERPVTIQEGTNVLAGVNYIDIKNAFQQCRKHKIKSIKYWDGASAMRIIAILKKE